LNVFIDTPTNGWSHLVASDIETLHTFAELLGLKKSYFQNKRKKNKKQPHYDVRQSLYNEAIRKGAVPVTRAELINFLKETYYTV